MLHEAISLWFLQVVTERTFTAVKAVDRWICFYTIVDLFFTCLYFQKWITISTRKTKKPPRCELCHYQFNRHKKFRVIHFIQLQRENKKDISCQDHADWVKILDIVRLPYLINLLLSFKYVNACIDKNGYSGNGPELACYNKLCFRYSVRYVT